METPADPQLLSEIRRYGEFDTTGCYACGSCTAVCALSKDTAPFPRRFMRLVQLGLRGPLRSSLEPWLCYYCGDCSTTCPRQAEPGESMMTLRRFLTAQYDFSGLSRLFYTSWKAETIAIILLALLVGTALMFHGMTTGDIRIYDGPGAFLPSSHIHIFDWAMAAVLTLLLTVNVMRMWWFTVQKGGPSILAILPSYIRQAYQLPLHFFTQKRFGECDRRPPWIVHLALMLSYVTMFTLIMFFLQRMQSGPGIDWSVHVFGYAATAGLIGATLYAIVGRFRAVETQYGHSHESDWIFLWLLLFVSVTGIVQHGLHRAHLDMAANIAYVIHLMGVVPMLILEVPFGKWAHMAYRPLAVYFQAVKDDAAHAASDVTAPAASPDAG